MCQLINIPYIMKDYTQNLSEFLCCASNWPSVVIYLLNISFVAQFEVLLSTFFDMEYMFAVITFSGWPVCISGCYNALASIWISGMSCTEFFELLENVNCFKCDKILNSADIVLFSGQRVNLSTKHPIRNDFSHIMCINFLLS